MANPSQFEFEYPLAIGNRWVYDFHVARDLEVENILAAIGKFFGYEFKDLVSDAEMQEEYHIVRRVDEVVAVKEINGVEVFLVECRNFNSKGEEKLAHATAVWRDARGYRLLNLLMEEGQGPLPGPSTLDLNLHVSVFHSDAFETYLPQGQLFLQLPLQVDAEWDIDKVVSAEELWLPAGWFSCLVVRRTMNLYGKEQVIDSYFADGAGLVQVHTPLYRLELAELHLASARA